MELAVASKVHNAGAAASDLFFDEVSAHQQLTFIAGGGMGGEGSGRAIEECLTPRRQQETRLHRGTLRKQSEHFVPDFRIVRAAIRDQFRTLSVILLDGGVEQGLDALPLLRPHWSRPRSSARSQVRATSQSRLTVFGEMPRNSAVSSIV